MFRQIFGEFCNAFDHGFELGVIEQPDGSHSSAIDDNIAQATIGAGSGQIDFSDGGSQRGHSRLKPKRNTEFSAGEVLEQMDVEFVGYSVYLIIQVMRSNHDGGSMRDENAFGQKIFQSFDSDLNPK
jgi:hypothetical protein